MESNDSQPTPKPKRQRQTHKQHMVRINLWMSPHQLELIDEEAKTGQTTRSQIIRDAIFWYLRPQWRNIDGTVEEYIAATLQRRKSLAENRKWMREHGHELDAWDS